MNEGREVTNEVRSFVIKLGLSILLMLFFTSDNANVTVNRSNEVSFYQVVFIYGLSVAPFGWSLIGRVQNWLWGKLLKLVGKNNNKEVKKDHEMTEKEIKKLQINLLIYIFLFPLFIGKWLIQFMISVPIGMVVFPIECISMIKKKKK